MRRFFVIGMMASVIFAGSVQAQSEKPELPWVWVSTMDNGDVTYLNVDSIKDLGGGMKQAWRLVSYSKPVTLSDGLKASSSRVRDKYNCIEESVAVLTMVAYGKPYGKGDAIYSHEFKSFELDWMAVPPDSAGDVLLKFVCNFK